MVGNQHRALTPALETDTAVQLPRLKQRATAAAVTTEGTVTLLRAHQRAMAPTAQTDVAVPAAALKQRTTTPVIDSNTAVTLTRAIGGHLAAAVEVTTTVPLIRARGATLTPALELDVVVTPRKPPRPDIQVTSVREVPARSVLIAEQPARLVEVHGVDSHQVTIREV